MILTLYRFATTWGMPVIRGFLAYRMTRGKEDAERFGERLGQPGRPRPPGPLIWLHGASVGESLSLLPLMETLLVSHPGFHVLVTTGTTTSAKQMAERLPEGAVHQYVPVDRQAWVRSFLDHWRPDLILRAESDLWPNLVIEPAIRGIPMILINGRMSPRSFAKWRFAPGMARELLSGFAVCLAQTETDAERLRALGAANARCVGNLKFAAPPLPVVPEALARLSGLLAGRPRWVAASTHDGEEALCGRVHRALEPDLPGLLTIIVPRHPDRGAAIAAALRADGLRVAVRSAGEEPTPETQIHLADTMGELGLFYRLAGVAFIGKSLGAGGGQNPLEAARLDCAVLHGPRMANFEDIARRMQAAGASEEVADEIALARRLAHLLTDEEDRGRHALAARAFALAEANVLEAVMAVLEPHLARLTEGSHAGA